jgi:hypothetical protein
MLVVQWLKQEQFTRPTMKESILREKARRVLDIPSVRMQMRQPLQYGLDNKLVGELDKHLSRPMSFQEKYKGGY